MRGFKPAVFYFLSFRQMHYVAQSRLLLRLLCLQQCLRRYYDERDTHQLENAGKYATAIVALGLRQAYSNHEEMKVFLWLGIVASVFATIYASYWDLCVDWGLLNRNSKNKWLRDKIITKNKSVYFMAIVSLLTANSCGNQIMHCFENDSPSIKPVNITGVT